MEADPVVLFGRQNPEPTGAPRVARPCSIPCSTTTVGPVTFGTDRDALRPMWPLRTTTGQHRETWRRSGRSRAFDRYRNRPLRRAFPCTSASASLPNPDGADPALSAGLSRGSGRSRARLRRFSSVLHRVGCGFRVSSLASASERGDGLCSTCRPAGTVLPGPAAACAGGATEGDGGRR